MGGTKRQAFLVKNVEAPLQFIGMPSAQCSEPLVLYIPKLEDFKCFPGQEYDDGQIAAISKAIDKAAGLTEKGKIRMFGKYDTFYDVLRIYTSVRLPEQLVNAVSNILAEPRISIRGSYKIVRKQENLAAFSGFGEFARARRMLPNREPYQPPIFVGSSSVVHLPRFTWVPVNNDPEVEFSVEGLALKTRATYGHFQGIEKMEESYKSAGMTYALLKYSVYLEWMDFTMGVPSLERNTFEKLYKNQPFSDCVIVASNKKEFVCHRSILAVHSDVLFTALGNRMKEAQTHRIVMEDVRGEAVELLLKFMYTREDFLEDLVGKEKEVVLDLIKCSHKYNVSELERFLCQFLCRKPADWFTVDVALSFYVFSVNVDSLENLTEKLWSFIRDNPQEISASTAYQEWLEKEPKVAAQFVLKLLESVHEQRTAVEVELALEEENEVVILLGDSSEEESMDDEVIGQAVVREDSDEDWIIGDD